MGIFVVCITYQAMRCSYLAALASSQMRTRTRTWARVRARAPCARGAQHEICSAPLLLRGVTVASCVLHGLSIAERGRHARTHAHVCVHEVAAQRCQARGSTFPRCEFAGSRNSSPNL